MRLSIAPPLLTLGSFRFGIIFGNLPEKTGLIGNLPAVSNDDNLRIWRIEIGARRSEHILRRESANSLPIGLQVVLRKIIEIHVRELRSKAILCGEAQR